MSDERGIGIELKWQEVCEKYNALLKAVERLNNICEYARNEIKDQRVEIKRLEKQRDAYQLKASLVEDRYLPCPDHRDKLTTDECMMCQIERLTWVEKNHLQGIAGLEAEIERLRADKTKWVLRCGIVDAENAKLRADKQRMDYLESESIREIDRQAPRSLFRRNMPITRDAVDEALAALDTQEGET